MLASNASAGDVQAASYTLHPVALTANETPRTLRRASLISRAVAGGFTRQPPAPGS